MKRKIEIEPYQPFFVSGLLISILGIGIWLLFYQGYLSFYPMEAHGFLMVMGFLFAYINGFLMTAIPKMSQSESATSVEVVIGLVMLWCQIPLAFVGYMQFNYLLAFLQIFFLFYFIGRRFFKRKANPPKAFVFLPVGLAVGAFGCLILAFKGMGLSGELILFAKNLTFQAFVLNLILGLGSRLVPALTRVQGAIDVRSAGTESYLSFLGPAIILNSAFVVEAFISVDVGQFIKFLVVLWMALWHLKIFSPLQVVGYLGIGIRASIASLGIGYLLASLLPAYSIHFLHLSFIGGFALLTFLVSTRVVLAHGNYNLTLELNHLQLFWFFILVTFIGVLRMALGFGGQMNKELTWILFIFWALSCVLWSLSFGRKLLKLEGSK